jgi:hypothetical protein
LRTEGEQGRSGGDHGEEGTAFHNKGKLRRLNQPWRGILSAGVGKVPPFSLERKMDQQEEAEGAEEERLARIGGFTCEG